MHQRLSHACLVVGGLILLVAMLLASTGCASVTDGVVVGLNESSKVLTAANTILAEQHRRERDEAVAEATTRESAAALTKAVHAKFKPRWDWYERIRSGWLAAASQARAAQLVEKTGGKPNLTRLIATVADVVAALEGFAAEVAPCALSPPSPPPVTTALVPVPGQFGGRQ